MSTSLGYNGGRFYSSLVQPVLVDCNFVVDSTNANGLGISSLKGSLVRDVFMYTTQTPGVGNGGVTNPMGQSASQGYALIKLKNNYFRYAGGFNSMTSPVTGSNLAINASALTVGVPYVITSVGHTALGAVTIAPVADVSGSLASTYFRLYDAYGNTFIIWFSVSGVGSAPVGVSGTLVQQSITTGDTAAAIGTALAITIAALPSGISGVFSFTAAGTTTVTVTSTQTNPYGPLPGAPAEGTIPTGFSFAKTIYNTNQFNWNAVGLPKGVVPSVGASFIATAVGQASNGASTGLVKAVGVSGISRVEVIGDVNQSIAPLGLGGALNQGSWILVQYMGQSSAFSYNSGTPSSSTVATTMIPKVPTDGTLVSFSFYMENKSVLIAGQ